MQKHIMDSQDPLSPGGRSHGAHHHVCTRCGWNYPNPHPSAKNRRSHKKICGTIKGFEILELRREACLDDEQKLPSPRVVEKAYEMFGDISEEDVFADAVSEFSKSDSFKVKEETASNCMAKSAKNPGEAQLCNKSPQVVQESCEVPPVEILENFPSSLENFPSSIEAVPSNRQGGEPSIEGRYSTVFVNLNDSSQVVTEVGDTISNVALETYCKEDLPDESESKLASALGKRNDTFDSSWNDDAIYSDVEGPHDFEEMSMVHSGEAEYTISNDNVALNTSSSSVETNADQVISTRQSARDDIPFTENADVSLDGTKHEEVEMNRSMNPSRSKAEKIGIQLEGICIGTEFSSSDKLLLEDKEFPSADNLVISKSDPEDIKMKAEEGELSFGASQETVESEILKASLPIVADLNADVNHSDLTGHEIELIQAKLVAEENSPNSRLSSESSCVVQHHVFLVLEGDNTNDQRKSSPETSIDSILEIGNETCESNDEARRESIKAEELVKEGSFKNIANAKDDPIRNLVSTGTAPVESAETANQKLLEIGRIGFNRVVCGLGVIQANEIESDVKAHNFYAEVPVTIESNDHRDFGRLQNLSEAHIPSLVSSPLVTRKNTSNAFESNLGSVSGLSDGVKKPENESQSSSLAVALSKNQEIAVEKTAKWSTVKEQQVPVKNLLGEARSARVVAGEAKKDDHESNIPRVSSILDQETSPRWPERREVSEEWNSPAKYQVELKRQERKVKGRAFWVPFVCCSSVK